MRVHVLFVKMNHVNVLGFRNESESFQVLNEVMWDEIGFVKVLTGGKD